ncbi:unnamed protein product [Ectocarpus sp. 6 AP-2014]
MKLVCLKHWQAPLRPVERMRPIPHFCQGLDNLHYVDTVDGGLTIQPDRSYIWSIRERAYARSVATPASDGYYLHYRHRRQQQRPCRLASHCRQQQQPRHRVRCPALGWTANEIFQPEPEHSLNNIFCFGTGIIAANNPNDGADEVSAMAADTQDEGSEAWCSASAAAPAAFFRSGGLFAAAAIAVGASATHLLSGL